MDYFSAQNVTFALFALNLSPINRFNALPNFTLDAASSVIYNLYESAASATQGVNLIFFPTGTTRAPRSGEEPGIDYMFISREKFLEMENNGNFLETGEYNGHYYGTPKPRLSASVLKEKPREGNTNENANPQVETEKTEVNAENTNDVVTVHRNGENLDGNTEDGDEVEKDCKNNNVKTDECLKNQPINV